MLGHQHVTDNAEAQFSSQIIKGFSALKFEAIGVKDAGSAVDVGCDVVKMIPAVIMTPPGHTVSLAWVGAVSTT
jgi:hypothetical protein